MATRFEITCVNKSDRFNPHERITHVGGRNPDGTLWRVTQEEAVQGMLRGEWAFYVRRNGYEVDVVVARSRFGHFYLKTVPDGEMPDNLLSLAECPR